MLEPLPSAAAVPPNILIDLDWQQPGRHELAERITHALVALGGRTATTREERLPQMPVDLVIAERAEALEELGKAEATLAVGLIVLGPAAPRADASLPLDFGDRELLLACRLVGEIVRLRRRSHQVERSSRELARLAAADPLTGLANRRAWDVEAPERLHRAQTAGQAVCLAIFDVDRFKAINYVHGYTTGDAVLSSIARELGIALRAADLLARLGGDEFAALLVGSFDGAAALAIVDRVRAAVGQHETVRLGFELSLSAGCAVAGGGAVADLNELFAAADAALREAKRAGRNRTC